MILYLLSTCPAFTLGFKTFFERNCSKVVVYSFDSLEKLKMQHTPKPGVIVAKCLQSNFETEAKELKKFYPEAKLMVATDPKQMVRVNAKSTLVELYFPVDEPLELTLTKILRLDFGLAPLEQSKIVALRQDIERLRSIHSTLSQKLAMCIYYISIDCTAKDISAKLNVSQRTVEGYFLKLEKCFGVTKKADLKEIYKTIERLENHFEERIFTSEYLDSFEVAVG